MEQQDAITAYLKRNPKPAFLKVTSGRKAKNVKVGQGNRKDLIQFDNNIQMSSKNHEKRMAKARLAYAAKQANNA